MKNPFLPFLIIPLFLFSCASSQKTIVENKSTLQGDYEKSGYSGPRTKVAVAKFQNATRFGQRRLGENITDVLSTELNKTQRFILLERAEVDKILEQVALSQTGLTEGSIEQIQLLDADYILTGTVTHYSVNTTGSSGIFTQSKKQEAEVAVDMRLINVRNGAVVFSETGRGKAEKVFDKVLGMGETGGYDESLEMDAFRAAVINLVENMLAAVDGLPWRCDVVKISADKLYIDAGRQSNLQLGDSLTIYHRGEMITNMNGAVIGYDEKMMGAGVVTDFFGNDGAILSADSLSVMTLPLFCELRKSR